MEKVINEFKVIETDDGFRIEIKGDKEAIREMLGGFGPHFFRGRGRRNRPFGPQFGFGPHFWTHFVGRYGPWEWEEEETEQEDTPKDA